MKRNRPLPMRLSLAVRSLALGCIVMFMPVTTRAAVGKEDAVDRYIQAEMVKRNIPGLSLAVVKDGKVVKAKGYGFANLEHKVPAAANTVYDLGSIGKQFTATGIMILVQRGQVDLDESISRYLPNLPASWKEVRVRNLLNHTAGIPDYFSAPGLVWGENYTYEGLVALSAKREPHFAPGHGWRYVNTNYVLLQRIIETISGQPWDVFLGKEVFGPLGMTSTRRATQDVVAHRAAPYELDAESKALRNPNGNNPPTLFVNGSGGLLSTVQDLAKWDAALYGERILKQTSLKEMWERTRLADGTVKNYGFAFDVDDFRGHRRIGHSGGLPGYETHIARFVDDKLTVIILTNRLGTNPWDMAGVVAGMVNPALASPSAKE